MIKVCFICGTTHSNKEYAYWDMEEISTPYRLFKLKDCCKKCGDKANSFLGYWGKKKPEDKLALKNYLLSGLLIQRMYSQMMSGGYYD